MSLYPWCFALIFIQHSLHCFDLEEVWSFLGLFFYKTSKKIWLLNNTFYQNHATNRETLTVESNQYKWYFRHGFHWCLTINFEFGHNSQVRRYFVKESFILISCVVSPVPKPGALLGVIMEGWSSTKATEHLSTEERPRHKMYFPAKKAPLCP